jgi:hypothetical protein
MMMKRTTSRAPCEAKMIHIRGSRRYGSRCNIPGGWKVNGTCSRGRLHVQGIIFNPLPHHSNAYKVQSIISVQRALHQSLWPRKHCTPTKSPYGPPRDRASLDIHRPLPTLPSQVDDLLESTQFLLMFADALQAVDDHVPIKDDPSSFWVNIIHLPNSPIHSQSGHLSLHTSRNSLHTLVPHAPYIHTLTITPPPVKRHVPSTSWAPTCLTSALIQSQ